MNRWKGFRLQGCKFRTDKKEKRSESSSPMDYSIWKDHQFSFLQSFRGKVGHVFKHPIVSLAWENSNLMINLNSTFSQNGGTVMAIPVHHFVSKFSSIARNGVQRDSNFSGSAEF